MRFSVVHPSSTHFEVAAMCSSSRYNKAWFLLALVLPLQAGCGGENKNALSGTVTWKGEPLPSGMISFISAEKEGTAAVGGKISKGEYSVTGVAPGKYHVQITITDESGVAPGGGRSRDDANADRVGDMKKRGQVKQAGPADAVTSFTKDVTPGMDKLDFSLDLPPKN
jgi:hypothetical protein